MIDWFKVSFDNVNILLNVDPPESESWKAEISWRKIIRICFKTGDYLTSDEIYIFTNERPESYVLPVDSIGGLELFNELISRKLFDTKDAIELASTTQELRCYPSD